MSKFTRRHFVQLGLGAPLIAAGVAGFARNSAAQMGKELRVATWGGNFLRVFEQVWG